MATFQTVGDVQRALEGQDPERARARQIEMLRDLERALDLNDLPEAQRRIRAELRLRGERPLV